MTRLRQRIDDVSKIWHKSSKERGGPWPHAPDKPWTIPKELWKHPQMVPEDTFDVDWNDWMRNDFTDWSGCGENWAKLAAQWYIRDPTDDARKRLCATCRHINFRAIYQMTRLCEKEPISLLPPNNRLLREGVYLGPYISIGKKREQCEICRLIAVALDGIETSDWMTRHYQARLRRRPPTKRPILSHRLADQVWTKSIKEQEVKDLHSLKCYILIEHRPGNWLEHRPGKLLLKVEPFSSLSDFEQYRGGCRLLQVMGNGTFEGRCVSPLITDVSWIKEALRACSEKSPTKDPRSRDNPGMLLIDIQKMRLTKGNHNMTYLALSYVWGECEQFVTTKSNIKLLMEAGGLDRFADKIPRTVKDAMAFCSLLEERYLWVDTLCIVQDDESGKAAQISCMDIVYGSASLVIAAAYGNNAASGLPGISGFERTTCSGLTAVDASGTITLRHKFVDPLMWPFDNSKVSKSVWNTRGWTYQERSLSRRVIFFTEEKLYWSCSHYTISEDENEPHKPVEEIKSTFETWDPALTAALVAPDPSHALPLWRCDEHKGFVFIDPWLAYQRAVKNYTARQLTYEKDVLVAFAGFCSTLGPLLGADFLCGIPSTYLEKALLWSPLGPMQRRTLDGETSFASWSWAGWKGRVWYDDRVLTRPWYYDRTMQRGTLVHIVNPSRLELNTLSVHLNVGSKVRTGDPSVERMGFGRTDPEIGFQRRLDILDRKGFQAGYICIPAFDIAGLDNARGDLDKDFHWRLGEDEKLSTALEVYSGRREFIVISASGVHFGRCVDPYEVKPGSRYVAIRPSTKVHKEDDPTPGSHRRAFKEECRGAFEWMQRKAIPSSLAPLASVDTYLYGFNTALYDLTKFGALWNVMMIEWKDNIAYRLAIGQVHTDALWEAKPQRKTIILG